MDKMASETPAVVRIATRASALAQWQARYIGGKVETLDLTADTREAVLERMRENIRYHLEYCP